MRSTLAAIAALVIVNYILRVLQPRRCRQVEAAPAN